MDIVQLKRFLILAETGHFRRAAARLRISQPALTHSIKTLEEELGGEIFVRSSKGVTLSDCGRALVPRARAILNERERIGTEIRDIALGHTTRLTVGVAPYFSRRLFPNAVQSLLAEMPQVRLEVIEGHSDELRAALHEGRIDLAFCVLSPSIEADDALERQVTCTERYSVVARNKHPLFARKRIGDRDLAGYPWVVYDLQRTPAMYAELFRERGAAAPDCPVATLSLPLMAALVANTDHLALMPEDFVWPEIAASRLRRIVGHTLDVVGRGGIIWRRDGLRGEPVKSLARHIRSVCEQSQDKAPRRRGTTAGAMGE